MSPAEGSETEAKLAKEEIAGRGGVGRFGGRAERQVYSQIKGYSCDHVQ